ncbi:MAG: HNH endonuclease [Prevotella sp.]|nr:HNH endonuclease [Prevotella sp.]
MMLHNGYVATLKQLYQEVWKYKDRNGVTGRTPEKTIQERVQRDDRFTRISSGVYALTAKLNLIDEQSLLATAEGETPSLQAKNQADFYEYLTNSRDINNHSRTNYMSWFKFLSQSYSIDKTLTADDIEDILTSEKAKQPHRDKYQTKRDISNFRAMLRKFRDFAQSDFLKIKEDTILKEVEAVKQAPQLTVTEKESIIRARVGQGIFRLRLIDYWQGCAIYGKMGVTFLQASHIKPWRNSTNSERLDVYNGLLLLPNYDKLFDRGYISFDRNGKIVVSPFLEEFDRKALDIRLDLRLRKMEPEHQDYLAYHRQNCFIS